MTDRYEFTLAKPTNRMFQDDPRLSGRFEIMGMTMAAALDVSSAVMTFRRIDRLWDTRWDPAETGTVRLAVQDYGLVGVWELGNKSFDVRVAITRSTPLSGETAKDSEWTWFKVEMVERKRGGWVT